MFRADGDLASGAGNPGAGQLFVTDQIIASDSVGAVVYRGTNQSVGSGSWITLYSNNEIYDTGGCHNGTYTERLTVPYAGLYVFYLNVEWQVNTTGLRAIRAIHSSSGNCIAITSTNANTASIHYMNLTGVYQLAAGDYIYFQAYQNSGSTLNLYGSNVPYGLMFGFARLA